MAVLAGLFFMGVLATSLGAILATIAPRRPYIAALLSGSYAAPVLVPVAQRRRVRRIKPFPSQSMAGSLQRAAA